MVSTQPSPWRPGLGLEREALALLTARKGEVIREETGAAIGEYNRLAAAGRRGAALLHSTC